jgi:hypothetical protein
MQSVNTATVVVSAISFCLGAYVQSVAASVGRYFFPTACPTERLASEIASLRRDLNASPLATESLVVPWYGTVLVSGILVGAAVRAYTAKEIVTGQPVPRQLNDDPARPSTELRQRYGAAGVRTTRVLSLH